MIFIEFLPKTEKEMDEMLSEVKSLSVLKDVGRRELLLETLLGFLPRVEELEGHASHFAFEKLNEISATSETPTQTERRYRESAERFLLKEIERRGGMFKDLASITQSILKYSSASLIQK